MNRTIIFPKRSISDNILKIYGVFTENEINDRKHFETDVVFFDSVDSAIDDFSEKHCNIDQCTLVELSLPELKNINLSSIDVVKTFEYLYHNVYKEMHLELDENSIDNYLLDIYLKSYAPADALTVSRVILGDKVPYNGSKLVLGTKTIYSLIDTMKTLESNIEIKMFNVLSQENNTNENDSRTLIIPK